MAETKELERLRQLFEPMCTRTSPVQTSLCFLFIPPGL